MNAKRIVRLVRSGVTAVGAVGAVPAYQWLSGVAQKNLNLPGPQFHEICPRFLNHAVKLRTHSSDSFVFRQIMIENEYQPLAGLPITTILDLGANIGLASAWLLSRIPAAEVFAVEAAADNYEACCENLALYGRRARVLHGAAWSTHAMLALRRKSCAADNWVQETEGDSAADVTGWSIAELIEMSGFTKIDLLKIDVEGAEARIFRSDTSPWLERVSNLCIELHSQECRVAFFTALAACEYQHQRSGELDICTNIRPKAA